MSKTITSPGKTNITKPTDHSGSGYGWKVVLFNCNCHTFQAVEEALMNAVGCSSTQASRMAAIVHNKGHCLVYEGGGGDCERVAMILEDIGLRVKVTQ